MITVSLMDTDICTAFATKQSCINGGACDVYNGLPYCKCKEGYEGEICQRGSQTNGKLLIKQFREKNAWCAHLNLFYT